LEKSHHCDIEDALLHSVAHLDSVLAPPES